MNDENVCRFFVSGPTWVRPAILREMTRPMIGHRSAEFKELFRTIITDLKPLFATTQDTFVATCSGTGLMQASLANCVPRRVLVTTCGAFSERWAAIAESLGLEVDRLDTAWGTAVDPDALTDHLRSRRAQYDAVTLTHNETSTGVTNDLAELARVVHEESPDTLVLVDAVSSLGGIPVLVDEWALEQALTLAEAGCAVSVNLSADSLGRNAFADLVDARIARTGVDPSPITFEITETAVLADVAAAARFAGRMKALGCRFALDDFGTGYAALTYLKEIPFDYIKIDVDFVRDLHGNGRSRLIVEGVVAIARCVGQQTIAEGVEDAAALALLRELRVDHAQGFLLGRPRALQSPAHPGRAGPEPRAAPPSASSLAGGPACRPPRSPARRVRAAAGRAGTDR